MLGTFKVVSLAAALAVLSCGVSYAQEIDLTQFFAKSTLHLADTERISANQERVLEGGPRAFADVKPAEVGDKLVFNTFNLQTNSQEKTTAVLKSIGKHCYVYLQEGKTVDSKTISKIVSEFDNKIYPETRSMFGSEWSPGIDDDKRIFLFLLDIQDGYNPSAGQRGFVAGYFNAGDCYTKKKHPTSNEREMLYIDIYPSKPGTEKFLSTIAHEFQHMIHWNNDPKEFTWVNESLSQLAPYLCGYGHPAQVNAFLQNPDNNLVAWSDESMIANYGQVYMWAQYISTKIASTDARRREFIRKMVAQKSQGFSGLNLAIKKQQIKNNARNIFRSFNIANYLNDPRVDSGIYSYDNDLSRFLLKPQLRIDASPFKVSDSVKCWSSKAVQVNVDSMRGKKINVAFAGQTIRAAEYSNKLDVALIHYSSSRKEVPTVKWLKVKENKLSENIVIPAEYDRMIAVILNMGPEQMKAEQAYAKNVGAANFTLAFRPIGGTSTARVASANTSSRNASTNRTVSKSIIEEISASIQEAEKAETLFVNAPDENVKSSAAIQYDLAQQKLSYLEKKLLASLKITLTTDEGSFILDFVLALAEKPESEKGKYANLIAGIKAVLIFEQSQGNAKAGQILEKFNSNL
jgi:hypothetical protein